MHRDQVVDSVVLNTQWAGSLVDTKHYIGVQAYSRTQWLKETSCADRPLKYFLLKYCSELFLLVCCSLEKFYQNIKKKNPPKTIWVCCLSSEVDGSEKEPPLQCSSFPPQGLSGESPFLLSRLAVAAFEPMLHSQQCCFWSFLWTIYRGVEIPRFLFFKE